MQQWKRVNGRTASGNNETVEEEEKSRRRKCGEKKRKKKKGKGCLYNERRGGEGKGFPLCSSIPTKSEKPNRGLTTLFISPWRA